MKKYLACMATATFLKFAYFGYKYYPILDDHIQYGVYKIYPKSFILFKTGTIYTRPLAAINDIFIWSNISLSLCLLIITAFHFTSSILFWKVFDKIGIKLSPLFFVIYLLFPPLSEATYWLSASTRLVTGMLAASAAMLCYVNRKRILFYVLFAASMLFYEQVASFSFSLICILYLYDKKAPIYPCALLFAVVAYYFVFRNSGALGIRENVNILFSDVIRNISNVYTRGMLKMFTDGFERSCGFAIQKPLYLIAICFSALFCGAYSYKTNKNVKCLYIGAILYLASYAPFFISGGGWISLRSLFVPVTALAIMAGFIPAKRMVALLTLVFLLYNTGETHDYYIAGKNDAKIVRAINESGRDFAVTKYIPESSVQFHEHIESVTASDWALAGALQNAGKKKKVGSRCIGKKSDADLPEIFDCDKFLWYNR